MLARQAITSWSGFIQIRFVASQLGGDNYVVGIDDVKLMTGDNTSSMATCTMAA